MFLALRLPSVRLIRSGKVLDLMKNITMKNIGINIGTSDYSLRGL